MIFSSGQTDIGRRRALNEDTVLFTDELFVVCDGMGGHKAGEVASKVAAEAIATFVRLSSEQPDMTWPYGFDPQISYNANRLSTAIKVANRSVFCKAASSDEYTGMGTTVAAGMLSADQHHLTYAHVGDSRIYLIRTGEMLQLTRDDSWANVPLGGANPDVTLTASMRNILTKALGARDEVDFDVVDRALTDGDVVLLCSDGLTNMVPDHRILEIVRASRGDLDRACEDLIAHANAEGGRDNISVLLVRYTA